MQNVRTRQLIAVVMVATALAADRVTMAAPILRPQIADTARKVANRISRSFCQVVPAARLPELRRVSQAPQTPAPRLQQQVHLHQTPDGHFQFRLPPPAC